MAERIHNVPRIRRLARVELTPSRVEKYRQQHPHHAGAAGRKHPFPARLLLRAVQRYAGEKSHRDARMFEALSFLWLPGCCLLCSAATRRKADLCAGCADELPELQHACRRCALPLARDTLLCGDCVRQPPPQAVTRAAFRYAYPLDSLVQRFKFRRDLAAGRLLGQLFAARIVAPPQEIALLPVPLHVQRFSERGFNQAAVLAQVLADAFDLPMQEGLVVRSRETAVQSGMHAAARRRNVRGAFSLAMQPLPERVAIVDDVVTTGSTVTEIAALLRKAGVAEVEVWALARTPPG